MTALLKGRASTRQKGAPLRLTYRIAVSIALIAFPTFLQADEIQPQDKFEAALRDRSTSPFVILLTVVDDRAGKTRTGCVMAPFLLGAIHFETGASSHDALDVALANRSHVFHFNTQKALDNIRFLKSHLVCDAVRRGLTVRQLDITGEFVIVGTGENLGHSPN
jgi:hypothetical protein